MIFTPFSDDLLFINRLCDYEYIILLFIDHCVSVYEQLKLLIMWYATHKFIFLPTFMVPNTYIKIIGT